jgi:hypothetical protein
MGTSTNLTNSFGGGSRPNVSGDPTLHEPGSSRLNRWFDTSKLSQPPAFTFGNTPRTLPKTRGDHIINFDFSLFKNNWIGERYNVQFRAEFFNLFNHVQFGMPDRTVGSPQFGIVSNQANKPRQIQFALKFIY